MCGDLKPWQYRHDVVVRMTQPVTLPSTGGNVQLVPASALVPLMQPLDSIEEVWLTEYQVVQAITLPTLSDMWRLSFLRSNLVDATSCNSSGTGVPFSVDIGSLVTHRIYDNPRKLSLTHKSGGITALAVDVTDEYGAPVSFGTMTFYLSFIMRKKDWNPEQVMRNDANLLEWWRPNTNVGRFVV
jgi:hypothetical protein